MIANDEESLRSIEEIPLPPLKRARVDQLQRIYLPEPLEDLFEMRNNVSEHIRSLKVGLGRKMRELELIEMAIHDAREVPSPYWPDERHRSMEVLQDNSAWIVETTAGEILSMAPER